MRAFVAVSLVFLTASCGSVDRRLYDEGDPPRLKNGSITMSTQWAPGSDEKEDVRRIACENGKITAELVSVRRGTWTGDVPMEAWVALWDRLWEIQPFEQDEDRVGVEPPETSDSGPYHTIVLRLGGETHRFSAQNHALFGVFTSSDTRDRLIHSDAIANTVREWATTEAAP